MTGIRDIIAWQGAAIIIACLLDLIFGDPDFKFHPIRIMGYEISFFEKLNRKIFPKTAAGERAAGFFMALSVLSINIALPFGILFFAYNFNRYIGVMTEGVICYFMLSAKSLARSAKKVYLTLLSGNIRKARERVGMIVGRDTESLDDIGITKAAVETVAENTGDGIVAPLLAMTLGGAVFACAYKAVNTMDSMVGYKNEKYINFGRFAARLDDAVNYIPSRLAAFFMIIASALPGYDMKNAIYIHSRDAHNHPSPNSAQTESVAAGALKIRLAGDMYYFGKLYKKPTIGDDLRDIQYGNILQMNRLMYATFLLSATVMVTLKFLSLHGVGFLQNIMAVMRG